MHDVFEYQCYFVNQKGAIQRGLKLEASTRQDAIKQILGLMRENPSYHAVELWQGPVKLWRKVIPADLD